jgi:alkyl hydroperoxide reductase subunit AhpF
MWSIIVVACGRLAVLDGIYDVVVVGSGPAGAVVALLTPGRVAFEII